MTNKTWRALTPSEAHIILDKGTEMPFSGEYNDHFVNGIYQCRQCGMPLYRSQDKFHSGCGWPSFDDEIVGAVTHQIDIDGRRTEILCAHCHGHLGHIFAGEQLTSKNLRHCVNSLSIQFVTLDNLLIQADIDQEIYGLALFAAGCFWGVEHKFAQQPGVLSTQVGYTGGASSTPSYEDVCTGKTGHAEALRLVYHRQQTSYAQLVDFFFSMHNPTQLNRQGVDIGSQYRSAIFYNDAKQQRIAEAKKQQLIELGQVIVTEVTARSTFWPAEEYHQRYYIKHPGNRFSCG